MRRTTAAGVLLTLAMLIVECTTGLGGNEGGGSEITNGKVVAMSGSPLAGREIAAYPETYTPGRTADSLVGRTVTGADGTFEFDLDSGITYNLYVVDTATGSGVCVRGVRANTAVGTVCLDTLGSIRGIVHPTDTLIVFPTMVVYSRGTPLRSLISAVDGMFLLDNVPTGIYSLSLARLPISGCAPGTECGGNPAAKPGDLPTTTVGADGAVSSVEATVDLKMIGLLQ